MLDEPTPTPDAADQPKRPARRRRAASRPAGPPVEAPATDAVVAPTDSAEPPATTEAPAPAQPPTAAPQVASGAPATPGDEPAAEKPARKTTRKRATRKTAPADPAPAAADAAGETPAAPESQAVPEPQAAPESQAAMTAEAAPGGSAQQPADDATEAAPAKPTRRRATRKQAPAAEAPAVAPAPTDAPAASSAPADPAAADEEAATDEQADAAPTTRRSRGGRVRKEVANPFAPPKPVEPLDQPATADATDEVATADEAATTTDEAEQPVDDQAAAGPDEGRADDATSGDDTSDEDQSDEDASDQDRSDDDSDDDDDDDRPRRRRRRRGGRRRRRGGQGSSDDNDTSDDDSDDDDDEGEGDSAKSSGRSSRSDDSESDDDNDEGSSEGGRRRRRRRRRGESGSSSDDDNVEVVERVREPRRKSVSDEVTGIDGSTRMEAKRQRRREGRNAGRRRAPILSEAEFLARRESVERTMVIRQNEELSQIAVLEDGVLVEHYVDRASASSLIGNVYVGRVQNVLPSMEAAFIDIGRGRNAVLYAGEVDWDSFGSDGKTRKVEKVLKSGMPILVQVTKDPVGAKGARLTNHVSLPGRYVVYAPGGHLSGISRKLSDTERKRLKDILSELVDDDASVIVRTAAEGASEDELVRDVSRLKAQWEAIEKKVKSGQAPQQLYAEPDPTVRIVRDLFTEDFSRLVIDGNKTADDAYDTVTAYVAHVAPHLSERIEQWDGAQGEIFAAHRIDEQIAKALERKVFLPSGGSLIIDRTEAMTVIDVNTGKFTGSGGNLEATVTSNNLEAAEEVVRQLRLRDIGGIIVIDFIDMVLPANRELLLRRLVECLGRDRTRHQVAEVTSLGLVQMTRKKIGTGLHEAFTEECDCCKGRGYEIHDMPVDTQAPADGGDRGGRRRRGGKGRGDDNNGRDNNGRDNGGRDNNNGRENNGGRDNNGGRGGSRGDDQAEPVKRKFPHPRPKTEAEATSEGAPTSGPSGQDAVVPAPAVVEEQPGSAAPVDQQVEQAPTVGQQVVSAPAQGQPVVAAPTATQEPAAPATQEPASQEPVQAAGPQQPSGEPAAADQSAPGAEQVLPDLTADQAAEAPAEAAPAKKAPAKRAARKTATKKAASGTRTPRRRKADAPQDEADRATEPGSPQE